MFKLIISVCFLFTILVSISKAQMAPPAPVENKVYDTMVGEWTADAVMMGMPFIDNLKIVWDLNHQFIVLDLMATGKANTSMTYQGKGIYGVDDKGNSKDWWFDTWGASMVSTGTGFFDGDVLTITEGNDMYKASRTFTVDGNQMTMHAKGTMVTSGKDEAFDETTIFMKK
ncbi:MAG: hypothetical protein ABI462_08740 [Ignavibacteria bacterium]